MVDGWSIGNGIILQFHFAIVGGGRSMCVGVHVCMCEGVPYSPHPLVQVCDHLAEVR